MALSHTSKHFAALAAILVSAGANASVITSTTNGGGGGGLTVISSSVATPNPGNDNVPALSPNTLNYTESFSNPAFGGATYANTNGPATEYTVTLTVTNNTGQNWVGFEVYTGAAIMTAPSYLTWFVFDYDLAPTITGPGTGSATWTPANATGTLVNNNWITYNNLSVPASSTIVMRFNLDLPVNSAGGWSIQQRPILVPTPGSAALLGLGGLAVCRRRRN